MGQYGVVIPLVEFTLRLATISVSAVFASVGVYLLLFRSFPFLIPIVPATSLLGAMLGVGAIRLAWMLMKECTLAWWVVLGLLAIATAAGSGALAGNLGMPWDLQPGGDDNPAGMGALFFTFFGAVGGGGGAAAGGILGAALYAGLSPPPPRP